MPANLPPEARAKLAKYSEAKTLEDKIRALEEFISSVPKHKGTENLLLWARRRLAELREELEAKKRKKSGGGVGFFVEKSGAAQIVILGPPNSGKSSILSALTNAKPEIADYPFTTKFPVAGILSYGGARLQLVDTPPILVDSPDSSVNNRVLGLARNSDALMVVVSIDDSDVKRTTSEIFRFLYERGIVVSRDKGLVRIIKSRDAAGVRIRGDGRLVGMTEDDVRKLLSSYRIYNAIVEIEGSVTREDIEDAIFTVRVYKPAALFINKIDLNPSKKLIKEIAEAAPRGIPVFAVSAKKGVGFEKVGPTYFKMLDLVRVYTKQPNKEPDPDPLVVKRGTTVIEVARAIHKDLARRFRYARVWGRSVSYPGQRVGADHVVEDGDIVEIHSW